MAKVLEMPKLSPTMTEGQLTIWNKKEGDSVAVDDLLAEVETDKATMEFRSFDKGTLLKLLVPAGAQVQLGQPVAILGAQGEDISALLARISQGSTPAASAAPALAGPPTAGGSAHAVPATSGPMVAAPESLASSSPPAAAPAQAGGRLRASPYVRKLARERNINLHAVAGTGPGGRIVARDVEGIPASAASGPFPAPQTEQGPSRALVSTAGTQALAGTTGTQALAGTAGTQALAGVPEADEVRPLSMMRKAIARRLTESKQTVPHFYLTVDLDAAPIARLREQINADLAASAGATAGGPDGAFKVSFNDLLIKACAIALVRVPDCNATFTPEAILVHHRVDISVAVAIPDGLVTPVVRQADRKSIVAIAQEVRDLASRAKAKKLRPEEMANGTFSISNLGMYGVDSFAAVINPPEGAILAIGRVRDEPVVWEGAVVPGKRLAVTLSCDHRVVDGAVGARFLAELRNLVERPTQMLVF